MAVNLQALNNLSPKEKEYALKILSELQKDGKSKSYEDLLFSDYKEIPVDIETFLHNENYLGKGLINEDGKFTVFPYWVETLKKIFPTNIETSYNTVILSGAIGLGKSFIAVIAMLYMLYRMLCLKNPYTYYGLQEIDHITFSFMNITMDAAKGVAWSKFQELVQLSPWFMAHGRVSRSINPEWQPVIDKGEIELVVGSQPRHVIGRAVFCLDGDTQIKTPDGDIALKDAVGKEIQVYSVDEKRNVVLSNECTVIPTIKTDEQYEIELEDGSIIKCTPNHKFLLSDGTYKEAQYLTVDDDIVSVQ